MDSPIVDICCITDSGYILPTSVMLTSVRQNKQAATKYRAHILHAGLSDDDISTLNRLRTDDFDVRLYPIDLKLFEHVVVKTHVPKTALAKFCLPELLPQLDRVIYLDGDIIVCKDLTDLFQSELGEHYVAAVRDMSGDIHTHFAQYTQVEKYINSGVLVMNLSLLRKEGVSEKMIQLKSEAPAHWLCMDQDVINVTCEGKTLLLPPRFNCMSPMWLNDFFTPLETINEYYQTNYDSWESLWDDSVVIHYAGSRKPWKKLLCGHRDIWMDAFRVSPVSHTRLDKKLAIPFYLNPLKKKRIFTMIPPENGEEYARIKFFNCFTVMKFSLKTGKKTILGFISLP